VNEVREKSGLEVYIRFVMILLHVYRIFFYMAPFRLKSRRIGPAHPVTGMQFADMHVEVSHLPC
jgi:hypothetical protein